MGKSVIKRHISKKGHDTLVEYLSTNHLYECLSEQAIKILSVNYVTLKEFQSFKYVDYRKLRWANRESIYELLAIAQGRPKKTDNGSVCSEEPHNIESLHDAKDHSMDIFLKEYRIENVISGRAYRALRINYITRSKFFSLSLEDFMNLKGVGKQIAKELYSIAEKYREEKNAKIINEELATLKGNIVCANDSELSDILQPVSGNIYAERFSKIFNVLRSLFEKIVHDNGYDEDFRPINKLKSVYSYLCSIRLKHDLFVCRDAGVHFLHEKNAYRNIRLSEMEEDILNFFDDAFMRSCIAFIGHDPKDEAYMNQVIAEALDDLQDKLAQFNALSQDHKHKHQKKVKPAGSDIYSGSVADAIIKTLEEHDEPIEMQKLGLWVKMQAVIGLHCLFYKG